MKEQLIIFDTTMRDGEQSPGASMTREEKLRIGRQLERMHVNVIEAGFPAASNGDFDSVKAVAQVVKDSIVCGLARATDNDIRRAGEAVKPANASRIHTFIATSPIHMQKKLRMQPEQVIEQAVKSVKLARSLCEDVEFSPEDAGRSEIDFLCRILEKVIAAGARTINIPDTVGYTMPTEFGDLIATIRRRVRGIEKVTISAHCHNDLGLAVANTLAAIAAGARQVECTINGIGERAGNASLEEIVMAMRVRPDRYPYETSIVGEHLFGASQLLSEITGVPVQPNKAITGRNAFAHEAGIHQDGVLKNPLTYEIMTPQSVGVPDSTLVLGKHSGRHALAMRCEQLGYQFDRRALDDIYRRFVRLADKIKHVEDHHLLELIRETHKPAASATPLIERIPAALAAAANAGSHEPPVKPLVFPAAENAAGMPVSVSTDHHEQEDYLWGV